MSAQVTDSEADRASLQTGVRTCRQLKDCRQSRSAPASPAIPPHTQVATHCPHTAKLRRLRRNSALLE